MSRPAVEVADIHSRMQRFFDLNSSRAGICVYVQSLELEYPPEVPPVSASNLLPLALPTRDPFGRPPTDLHSLLHRVMDVVYRGGYKYREIPKEEFQRRHNARLPDCP